MITDSGLLARSGELIREALGEKGEKLCIVADDQVTDLYAGTLETSLQQAGYETVTFTFPLG